MRTYNELKNESIKRVRSPEDFCSFYPHIYDKAIEQGNTCIVSPTGSGKTTAAIDTAREYIKRTGKRAFIIVPLRTIEEGKKHKSLKEGTYSDIGFFRGQNEWMAVQDPSLGYRIFFTTYDSFDKFAGEQGAKIDKDDLIIIDELHTFLEHADFRGEVLSSILLNYDHAVKIAMTGTPEGIELLGFKPLEMPIGIFNRYPVKFKPLIDGQDRDVVLELVHITSKNYDNQTIKLIRCNNKKVLFEAKRLAKELGLKTGVIISKSELEAVQPAEQLDFLPVVEITDECLTDYDCVNADSPELTQAIEEGYIPHTFDIIFMTCVMDSGYDLDVARPFLEAHIVSKGLPVPSTAIQFFSRVREHENSAVAHRDYFIHGKFGNEERQVFQEGYYQALNNLDGGRYPSNALSQTYKNQYCLQGKYKQEVYSEELERRGYDLQQGTELVKIKQSTYTDDLKTKILNLNALEGLAYRQEVQRIAKYYDLELNPPSRAKNCEDLIEVFNNLKRCRDEEIPREAFISISDKGKVSYSGTSLKQIGTFLEDLQSNNSRLYSLFKKWYADGYINVKEAKNTQLWKPLSTYCKKVMGMNRKRFSGKLGNKIELPMDIGLYPRSIRPVLIKELDEAIIDIKY